MNRKVFSAVILLALVQANPGFAQSKEYEMFVGIAVGQTKYRDETHTVNTINSNSNVINNVTLDDTSVGYKLTVGLEGERLIGGIDYINWGDFKGNTNTRVAPTSFTISPVSYGPWIGYKIGGAYSYYDLHIIPKIGYALTSADASVAGRDITDDKDALLYGISLAFERNERFTIAFDYDWNDFAGIASVGLRYKTGHTYRR